MYFEEAVKRTSIPIHPAYNVNVARYLGDTEALDISDYCAPKKLPEDEWERNTYLLFWEEWHRRRGVTNA